MKYTETAGGVVLNNRGEVLVVNQHGRVWSLPKGCIENGEEALTAAKREIHEESGITNLDFVKDLGTYQRHKMSLEGGDDPSEFKTIHFFLFTTRETRLKPLDPANPEAKWIDKDEVANYLTHQKDKIFFLSIKDKI